jgi:hypothetical protein
MSTPENPNTLPESSAPERAHSSAATVQPAPTMPVGSVLRRDRPTRDLSGPDSRTAAGLTELISAMRANRQRG